MAGRRVAAATAAAATAAAATAAATAAAATAVDQGSDSLASVAERGSQKWGEEMMRAAEEGSESSVGRGGH